MPDGAFEKIHNINHRFNKVFSKPVYYFAKVVTIINFLLPYSLRIAVAFTINIFFNRPAIYLNFLARKLGKKINFVVVSVFYFVFFGIYAVFCRFFGLGKPGHRKDSAWIDVTESLKEDPRENYFYQS